MTISSVGYNGGITAIMWPVVAPLLGQRYTVPGPDQATCTPVQNGTRQISIGTGVVAGHGVWDNITAAETITLGTVSSQTNWYMVVARRTWQSTNTTTLSVISAGTTASAAVPPTTLPTRNATPGTIDDQPLWLVPLTVNDTVPGTPIDLRVMGSGEGSRYVRSALALQYLETLGAEVWLGDVLYRRQINAAGTGSEWIKTGPYLRSALSTFSGTAVFSPSTADGWDTISGEPSTGLRDRNTAWAEVAVRRSGEALTFSSDGGLSDSFLGTLTPDFRPPRPFTMPAQMQGGPSTNLNASYTCNVSVSNSGAMFVTDGPANLLIPKRTTVTDWSLRIHVPIMRGDAS